MGYYRAWRPVAGIVRTIAAASFALLLIVLSGSTAFAGTTGVISGKVTDSSTGAPLADVAVTAASPSGNYTATTNARGFYSMAGVYADTYTVSFQHPGYEPQSEAGVSVFADQVATVSVTMLRSLKTIARVVAHSEASAYQPSQTTDTYTVNSQQVQNFQGSSFNGSETNLLTSLPGAMADSSGYPVIHGGREYEEGFEFEGIPYTDAYSNQFTNSLGMPTAGVQSVQLTPGAGNATQSGGGTGTFNIVAKRGTYPGYGDFGVAIGGGAGFDHRLNTDFSWALPNGRMSDFASFAASDYGFAYGNGSTPLAQLGAYYRQRYQSNREFLNNFVWRFGHNNNQSLQFFVDIAQHNFYEGAGGLQGLCFASCDPVYDGTWGGIYGFTTPQIQGISALYPGQSWATETLAEASNRAPATYFQPNQAMKLEYTNNLNSSTFFSAKFYRVNSVTAFDFPGTFGNFYGDAYVLQGGQTTGLTLSLQKQLNDRNLFQVGMDYNLAHPIDSYRSDSYGLYGAVIGFFSGAPDIGATPWAFINPNDPSCPLGPGGCGYAYGTGPVSPTAQLTYPQFNQVSTVNRQDYSLYANDKADIGNKLKAEVGVRLDMATYRLPTPGVDPTYCTSLYLPSTWTVNPNYNSANPMGGANCPYNATYNFTSGQTKPKVLQPRIGLSYEFTPTTAVRVTYDRAVQFVPIASVDFGEVTPGYYINQPYGSLPAVNLLTGQVGGPGTNCGFYGATPQGVPYTVPCKTFGEQLYWAAQNFDGIAYQPAYPMTSDNYQVTLQHQFTKGILNGIALSIAPWYRFQHNTTANEASPVIGPNGLPEVVNGSILTYPPVLSNAGKEFASGVDLNITRQIAYGLSGQFTASYINEFSSVIPTSASEDFYPNIVPASLLAGNIYRVGFVSPFQTTLGLTYQTRSGWRINPRISYNIGYPTGLGTLAPAIINGKALNLPNTNTLVGNAPNGPAYFVDPMNPGSVFSPNIVAGRGNAEAASPGGKLGPPNTYAAITLEYDPRGSKLSYGVDVENLFNETYDGALFNARYQPIATGITGPLTGYSTNGVNFSNYPSAWPQYGNFIRGKDVYVNIPGNPGRSFYFYIQARL